MHCMTRLHRLNRVFIIFLARIGAHLLQIMPRAEGLAGRTDDDAADIFIRRQFVQALLQRPQHLL